MTGGVQSRQTCNFGNKLDFGNTMSKRLVAKLVELLNVLVFSSSLQRVACCNKRVETRRGRGRNPVSETKLPSDHWLKDGEAGEEGEKVFTGYYMQNTHCNNQQSQHGCGLFQ
eukprot:scaffold50460_cov79-Cyclotella_meneghiniana.AAC.3